MKKVLGFAEIKMVRVSNLLKLRGVNKAKTFQLNPNNNLMKIQLISRWASFFAIVFILSSCLESESEFEKQIDFEEKLLNDHFQQNNITATRDNSGIYYQVLEENSNGTPVEEGDVVAIRYVMRTLNGKMVDSLSAQQETDTAIYFQHIGGAVYPEGINLGVRLMNEGEKFRFYFPSYRAFNQFSYKTLLPSESLLVTDIEVIKVESADDVKARENEQIKNYIAEHALEGVTEQSNGIFYQKLDDGSGELVKSGQEVEISYKGYYLNNEVFDESEANQPIKFPVDYSNVIKGLQEGMKLMKKGEKGRIFVPSHLAYGAGVQVVPEVVRNDFLKAMNMRDMAPFRTLIFDVELEDID